MEDQYLQDRAIHDDHADGARDEIAREQESERAAEGRTCAEILAALPERPDLIVVSPPYGMVRRDELPVHVQIKLRALEAPAEYNDAELPF